MRLQQHGIAQVDAKDAEINDLKKNKPSGLSAEDEGYIKLMYENLKNGEMKGAIRVKYTFVTDPTQITPPFKNK